MKVRKKRDNAFEATHPGNLYAESPIELYAWGP